MPQRALTNVISKARPFAALLLLIIFSLSNPILISSAYAVDNPEKELLKLKSVIQQLKDELKKVKGAKGQLENQLEKSEVDIGTTLKRIEELKSKLKNQQVKLKSLNQERQQLQLTRRQQQKHITEEIQAAYKLGRQSNLKLLLNNQNPAELSRQLRYHDYFLAARADQIDAYIDTISQLDRVEPAIQEKQQQLSHSKKELESRFTLLQASQASRKQTLTRLQQVINSKDSELRKQDQDRRRLEKLINDVQNAIANLRIEGDSPFTRQKGKLSWPVRGRIQHNFGTSRILGKINWDGMIIKASSGSRVKAIHHGRVVFADYLRGYGLLVIVDHGEGYMSLYGRNQSLLKSTGDWVSAGDAIATVGASGGQSQAGLYFAIRKKGKPTNPKRWLKRA